MDEVLTDRLTALSALMAGGEVMILSGAGLSTESGIPDYRGPSGAVRRFAPMTYQTFTGDPAARRRYWARSHVGWHTIARAAPNAGHRAVAELQSLDLLTGIVTQNVDGLHTVGGADPVLELHGNLTAVRCLDCNDRSPRDELDRRLRAANPGFEVTVGLVNPDGDADLDDAVLDRFRTVGCRCCGGMLKPDVVFFGEHVPADRVRAGYELVDRSQAVLVLGSSLTVLSGRRFVLHAAKRGIPVAIVNQGSTRADPYAALRVDAPLGMVLPELTGRLRGTGQRLRAG